MAGPARVVTGPVRFLCTLLWGLGGLGSPWHRHWVLLPSAPGQTTAEIVFKSTAVPFVRCPISGFEEDTKLCTYESSAKVHTLEDGE